MQAAKYSLVLLTMMLTNLAFAKLQEDGDFKTALASAKQEVTIHAAK